MTPTICGNRIGAALMAGCGDFLTHDRRIPTIRGLKILQLKKYL